MRADDNATDLDCVRTVRMYRVIDMCSGARIYIHEVFAQKQLPRVAYPLLPSTYMHILLYIIFRWVPKRDKGSKKKIYINKEENIDSSFQHYATDTAPAAGLSGKQQRRLPMQSSRVIYYFYYYYTNICRYEPAVSISFQRVLYYYITRRRQENESGCGFCGFLG